MGVTTLTLHDYNLPLQEKFKIFSLRLAYNIYQCNTVLSSVI